MQKKKMWSMIALASTAIALGACSSDDEVTTNTNGTGSGTTRSAVVDASLASNTVNVVWKDTAVVSISSDLEGLVTASVTDGKVAIFQGSSVASEITYTLSGSSSAGSLYMDGKLKATFVLNGLTLTAPQDSAAINIQDGKRIAVQLASGTTNTLTDLADGSQKACFMVNGHTEFKGGGSLTLYGNTKHAFWGDEYVEMKSSTGTITVAKAVKDGFNINQYFLMSGGTLNISGVGDDGLAVSATDDATDDYNGQILLQGGTATISTSATAAKAMKCESDFTITDGTYTLTTSGGGEYDSDENDAKGAAGIKVDGSMAINGGTMTIKSTGAGGKGISVDGTLTMTAGTVNVTTTGNTYYYTSSISTDPKGVKSDGAMTISGGTLTINSAYSEGLESKSTMDITGGEIYSSCYDDALNSSSHMVISGGKVFARSTNNDAIDSNGNLTISGGYVVALGARTPENALDAAEGYNIYINGGTIVGIGGSTALTSSSSSQSSVAMNVSSLSSKKVGLYDASGNGIVYFEVPSSIGGNAIMISSPSLSAGTTYYLRSNASYSGTTWNGLGISGTLSSNTSNLLSSGRAAKSVGSSH